MEIENVCDKRTQLFDGKDLPHLFSIPFKVRKKLKLKCYYCGKVATEKERLQQIGV